MRRFAAAVLLFTARRLIRWANRINPPKTTWVDGSGKRWVFPARREGIIAFRNDTAIYTGGPTGPAMQRYLDELESQGWN